MNIGASVLSGIGAGRQPPTALRPHADPNAERPSTPSWRAARCHALGRGGSGEGGGAVSATKRSIAAAIAAASPREGVGVISSILGLGGRRLPFRLTVRIYST
jgi:hypothetical protein